MTINEAQDAIIEDFEACADWFERYQLICDYGKELNTNPLPEEDKTDQNKIDGCQSQVWFTCHMDNGVMILNGDADAQLVKGIVAMLLSVLNGHTPKEILDADLYFIERVGLQEHLNPTRSNGLLAMLKQIRLFSLAYANR